MPQALSEASLLQQSHALPGFTFQLWEQGIPARLSLDPFPASGEAPERLQGLQISNHFLKKKKNKIKFVVLER